MVVTPSRTAPPPKRLPAGKRRQQLLDVALSLFATKGYNATTMDDIAETAGVTKPLLYQHFASKRALYLELVDSVATTMLAAIGEATRAAASSRQQVEGGFAAYFDLVVTHAHAFQLLFGSTTPDDPELSDMLRHVEDVLAAAISPLIDAGLDDDHRQLLAYAVVGMAEGASRHVLAKGAPSIEGARASVDAAADGGDSVARRLASRLADLAWAGLRSVHRD